MAAEVKPCTCKHDGQDQLNGKGQRVHNLAGGGRDGKVARWRCTVCKAEKSC